MGGTFDPIHNGHLVAASEVASAFKLDEVVFVPTGSPYLKEQVTPAEHRYLMTVIATASNPRFKVSRIDIDRGGDTYTVDTLRELRAEWPTRPLCLLLGMDAFLGLPGWREWERIVELAHLVVAHRPGWQMPAEGVLGALLANRATRVVRDLHAAIAGRVHVHAVTQLEISSTGLRDIIVSGRDPRFLVSEPVREIIRDTGCYARHGRSPR